MSAVLEKTISRQMNSDEFAASPFAATHELIKGELYRIMPAGFLHGVVTQNLSSYVSNFVRAHGLGVVVATETGFRLSDETTCGADIAFVSQEKLAAVGLTGKFFPTAPDLAVEVLSPSETKADILGKVEDYLLAGVKLIWIVRPTKKAVFVYRQNNTISILRETDTLDSEEVLPGLNLKLSEIFGGF
jgi:Uma2 family endonuclease